MKRPRPTAAVRTPAIGAARARHLQLAARDVLTEAGPATVTVNDGESPLAWLARRKGRDGQPLIAPAQFLAGERLRADFTRASLSPRVTSAWAAPVSRGSGGRGGAGEATDAMVAARQRMQAALKAYGPEFSGLLMDVCCFLQRLEEVEAARGWPARSAKVVLQLALDRLARHYGLGGELRGPARAPMRAWAATDGAAETGTFSGDVETG
jgi:hypothetical protein